MLGSIIPTKICKDFTYSDKDVNDCDAEDEDKCWKITPARLATKKTTLTAQQTVLALGKILGFKIVIKKHTPSPSTFKFK